MLSASLSRLAITRTTQTPLYLQGRLISTFKNTMLEYFKGNPSYAELLHEHKFPIAANPLARGDARLDLSGMDEKQLVLLSFSSIADKSSPRSYSTLKEVYNHFKSNVSLFEKLSLMETSVVCNSFFIENVVVSSKPILRRICQSAIDELETSGVTVKLLPLLKVLRKADFRTDLLMDAIAQSLSRCQAAQCNIAQLSHALAVLADGSYFNPQLTDAISSNVRLLLEKTKASPSLQKKFIHPEEGARVKDLTRLLWALSCLKVQPSFFSSAAEGIVEEIQRRLETGHVAKEPHLISDLLLSLACWRIYPIELIGKLVNAELIHAISSQNRSNRASRFALFATCAQWELPPEHLPPLLQKSVHLNVELTESMEKQLKKRRLLGQILMLVQSKAANLGWTNLSCSCPVPYLNICGITFETNGKKIALEVLDPLVCMRHTEIPDRLMTLKIRLMQQRGYHVIQVPPSTQNKENGQLVENELWDIMERKIHEYSK